MSILQPTLDVGAGWSGATSEPGVIGSGAGSDAKAIALWDVVQWQTFGANIKLGVVAFHINGIDRIEFACDNGTWVSSTGMSQNTQSGVWEFYATLPIDACQTDGLREIRAIAYPVVGLPRLLPSLFLFSNRSATLPSAQLFVSSAGSDLTGDGTTGNPYLTILKALQVASAAPVTFNGCSITIKAAGTYIVGSLGSAWANTRWVTIEGDSGLAVSAVKLVGIAGAEVRPKLKYCRYRNVTFDFSLLTQIYPESGNEYWFDAIAFIDSVGWTHAMATYPVVGNGATAMYVTDSTATNMFYGFCGFTLVRNVVLSTLSGDALSQNLLTVNVQLATIKEGPVALAHVDVMQHFGTFDQMIVYGVKAFDAQDVQVIFDDKTTSSFTNVAYVNVVADCIQAGVGTSISQLCSAHTHALYYHLSILGQNFELRNDLIGGEQFTAANVAFRNCVLNSLRKTTGSGLPSGVIAENCHLLAGEQLGTAPSTGAVTVSTGAGLAFTYAGVGALGLISTGAVIQGMNAPTYSRGAYVPLVEVPVKGVTATSLGMARSVGRFL